MYWNIFNRKRFCSRTFWVGVVASQRTITCHSFEKEYHEYFQRLKSCFHGSAYSLGLNSYFLLDFVTMYMVEYLETLKGKRFKIY
jgi:hypothetical protein